MAGIGIGNIFLFFFLCIVVTILIKQYWKMQYLRGDKDKLAMNSLKDYLLSQEELRNANKPILWIHIPYEYNARNWQSWGSRSSWDLNQPYLYLCIQSILRHCDQSFKICIIDDASFAKLLPSFSNGEGGGGGEGGYDINKLSMPLLAKVRQLQLLKLLREYGGMICPVSFVCLRDLIALFQEGSAQNRPFLCQRVDVSSTSVGQVMEPSCQMMGVRQKQDPILIEIIHYAEQVLSQDATAESLFLGKVDRYAGERASLIQGKLVGTETIDDHAVVLENLFSDDFGSVAFYPQMYGIWVPMQELLHRIQYGWFLRSSVEQLISAEPSNVLEKYLILANSPDNLRESFHNANQPDLEVGAPPSKWISFWRTPMGVYSYGLQPILLGDTVPHKRYV